MEESRSSATGYQHGALGVQTANRGHLHDKSSPQSSAESHEHPSAIEFQPTESYLRRWRPSPQKLGGRHAKQPQLNPKATRRPNAQRRTASARRGGESLSGISLCAAEPVTRLVPCVAARSHC
ncbi:secretory phospholipase A2 [Metarhizium robertsii ARSEF 23]|uniref:Secretory phospholipase A2 n=1 Tax=Metarhizium robertsii (strain ARSEF 23 / ATCC MYA-3075) TaxID=655844 RepID=A0A0B2XIA8_METRA|nr:secretory phospholipase A2 [Metarhizium robertsii ARSEF 23]KHO11247.1 secretory phospholipase A2 [Metarhizium robertsii ARSEF 23]